MRIEHIALNVPESIEQTQWYVQHLGMKIIRQVNDPAQTHFIADENGHVVLEFYTRPQSTIPDYFNMHPLALHIAFVVDNFDSEYTRLIEAGATPIGDIEETATGDRLVFLRDPWGVCIQLAYRTKPLNP